MAMKLAMSFIIMFQLPSIKWWLLNPYPLLSHLSWVSDKHLQQRTWCWCLNVPQAPATKHIQNWTHFPTNPVPFSSANATRIRILEFILDFIVSFPSVFIFDLLLKSCYFYFFNSFGIWFFLHSGLLPSSHSSLLSIFLIKLIFLKWKFNHAALFLEIV